MSITDVARNPDVDLRCVKDAEKKHHAQKCRNNSLKGVSAITIDEMIQMASMVEKHLEGILGCWDFGMRTAGLPRVSTQRFAC